MDAKNEGAHVEVATLAAPEAIKSACSRLKQVGITCVMPGASIPPESLVGSAIPLTNADYSFLDQQSRPAVRGLLMLSNAVSPGGNQYFHAYSKVFKFGFMGIPRPMLTSSYDRQFWREVGRTIPISVAGDDKERAFAADMDREIEAARDAAKREADAHVAEAAKKASEAAYRASPAYKKAQAKNAVDACRRQIAYARSLIAQDDRVARISGYENVRLRESAAASIVQCEDTIARGGY
ncbi:hypothetical protein [Burkholderia vietnamiensis]|uniref:hypothetical protein n=1 Tax=Burkholderia vietnamiensis TaxID=60552 RepID=UPI001CF578B4|nr:hypothetical protein [Burkholderia vietnamiensis]MCA7985192.1 hypothetical protein [Burkholderia vietnamiensis]